MKLSRQFFKRFCLLIHERHGDGGGGEREREREREREIKRKEERKLLNDSFSVQAMTISWPFKLEN